MDLAPQTKHVPDWKRNPATVDPPKNLEEFTARSNQYFEECLDKQERPTITGYALAIGLPGPTSLIRLGQRIPELRYVISRCMTAIANEYEELIGYGNAAGALFMLKNIPDFDPDEPAGAPPIQFFNDRKEVLLQTEVIGAAYSSEEGSEDEDPIDAYMRLVRRIGFVPDSGTQSTAVIGKQSRPSTPLRQTRRALTILTEGFEDD